MTGQLRIEQQDNNAGGTRRDREVPPPTPWCFMHVPKTGGNTLAWTLTTLLPSLRIAPSPALGVWTHRGAEIGGYDLYAGHFDYDFVEEVGAGFRMTTLRHPVARMVSLYDFWRGFRDEEIEAITRQVPDNGPRFASAVGFDEFLRHPTPFVRGHVENGMTRQLLGRAYDALSSDRPATISVASRRLGSFDWIGVTERFGDSLAKLSGLVGVDIPTDTPRLNSSYDDAAGAASRRAIARTVPTRSDIDLILRTSAADMALYERFAGERFAGESFAGR